MRKSTTLGLCMLLGILFSPNLLKAQPDGTMDTSYHPLSAWRGAVYADGGHHSIMQKDGKTLHAGAWAGTEQGVTLKWLMRVNTDGTIDVPFENNLPSAVSNGHHPTGVAIQMINGKEEIVFSTNTQLLRVNEDGTQDNTFTPAVTNNIWGLAVQPNDQKVLICLSSTGTNTLMRLNTDGTKDTSFHPDFKGKAVVAMPQKDGKILVGGNFTDVNSKHTGALVRLNADGSLDGTFDVSKGGLTLSGGSGDIRVINIVTQDDGKYLVVGNGFNTYNGTTLTMKGIIRVNPDGSLDEDFNKGGTGTAGGYANGPMELAPASGIDLVILPDGKIILVGSFETYNGTSSRNIVKLNSDGTIDPSFDVGGGFTSSAGVSTALSRPPASIVLESDTSIIVAGTFSGYYDASHANNIVRLKNTVKSTAPTASITIKSLDPPPSYCLNSKVNITYEATGTYNTGNVFTAQLSDANGSFASPTAIGSVTATASGVIAATIPTSATAGSKYRIRVVSSNPALTGDDNGTDFSINSGVDMTKFIIKTSPDPAVVCKGDEVTLSGAYTGTGLLPKMTYTWDNGITDNKAFAADATKTYTMTAKVLSCTTTRQVTVTVNPLPNVTATAKPDVVCAGDETTLTGGGAKTYSWDNGVTDGKSFAPKTSQAYTVTGKDANGCTNTASVKVTVNPLPKVTATAKPDAVCAGDETTLTGGGAKTYTWDNGVTDGKSFAPKTSQAYTVTGKDANGCVNTASVKVTVNPLPNVTATANPGNTICVGNTVTLNGGGASTYTWNNGVTDNVAFTPDATKTYTVTGKDANGCTGTADITVTLKDTAVVMIADSICSGDTYTLGTQTLDKTGTYTEVFVAANGCDSTVMLNLTVNQVDLSITQKGNELSAVAGATSYQWINCMDNAPISGATSQTYTSDVTGDYAVIVTMGDCSDTSTCYHIEGVGIHENDFKQSITLYPNPNHGTMTVTSGSSLNNATVRIVNVVGQIVMEKSKLSGNRFAFDVQRYAAGVYYLEISEGSKVARIKFVKD